MKKNSARLRPVAPVARRFAARELGMVLRTLARRFGPQHWWPARTPFEVMAGAILTQNTNWRNVERALDNLKAENLLSPEKIFTLDRSRLERLIRPSGYFRLKAGRLASLVAWLVRNYRGSVRALGRLPTDRLRRELLDLRGVGPETADSILLYALGRPVFVVDAYTRRIFSRHRLFDPRLPYREIQDLFAAHLPRDPAVYNEFHALIVRLAKTHCHSVPRCAGCPLARRGLRTGGPAARGRARPHRG